MLKCYRTLELYISGWESTISVVNIHYSSRAAFLIACPHWLL